MTTADKPFSPASARNSEPIAERCLPLLRGVRSVLEIGSGTGQHAVYLGSRLAHLTWQPSDMQENLPGIRQWIDEAGLPNVLQPVCLNVDQCPWPVEMTDAVFTANTFHIMSWSSVENAIRGASRVLENQGLLCVYGPFRYGAAHTSESNARFDASLRARDSHSGIRDFEAVCELAQRNRMELEHDYDMPANNRMLVFRKRT